MKQLSLFAFFLLAALVAPAHQPKVLYLYGDVSAEGDVPSGKKDPFHQMRLNDTGELGMSEFREAIEAVGISIEEAYDAETTLNAETLAPYDVLILGSNQHRFDAAERAAVVDFVEGGKGVIAWSDSGFGGHYGEVGLGNELGRLSDNDIMSAFGMYFMTDNGAGNYLIRDYEFDHYLNAHDRNGGIAFRGEGVSLVRVSEPARVLAKLQESGLGGAIRLNPADGKLNPETDAALAIAEVKKGRAIGVFDRNLFWNAGPGTRLSHSDNREFTQRLIIWAAGKEDEIHPDKPSPGSAFAKTPPKVTLSSDLAEDGKSALLVATVTVPDNDGRIPEVTWQQLGDDSRASFENNNPNAPTVRVLLPEPGAYRFRASVSDGEFSINEDLTLNVEPRNE